MKEDDEREDEAAEEDDDVEEREERDDLERAVMRKVESVRIKRMANMETAKTTP